MAESAPAFKTQMVQKSVQELVLNGDELPENYIHKDRDGGDLDVPLVEIPVVNLGLLKSLSTSKEELQKLRSALSTWGCIQLTNHGMTPSFLDEVREVTKQFFALPMEEKQKYSRDAKSADGIEGYGNDKILSEKQILNGTERLHITLNPEQRKLKFWPENPKVFRDILNDYTIKLSMVIEIILTAMARSLDLEDNCFLDQYGKEGKMNAGFNYYPKCPRPDLVIGIEEHTDAAAITFLLQDNEVEGLQFQKDNQWFKVPIIPEALLVIVGDQAEIMSNGIFKSPVHRVVTNSERERISLAVFCLPGFNEEIGPIDRLVDESRPRLYKKVKNYVSIYLEYFKQRKRPIEAVKI
ncbi:protein SRG1-like [Castanea sativa]|uniref:protein SRG1-like n=1 Tax=Castanea sativa TaxID=21020 RepID=UPI003F649A8E